MRVGGICTNAGEEADELATAVLRGPKESAAVKEFFGYSVLRQIPMPITKLFHQNVDVVSWNVALFNNSKELCTISAKLMLGTRIKNETRDDHLLGHRIVGMMAHILSSCA